MRENLTRTLKSFHAHCCETSPDGLCDGLRSIEVAVITISLNTVASTLPPDRDDVMDWHPNPAASFGPSDH